MHDLQKAVEWGVQAADSFRRAGHDVWLAATLSRLAHWYSGLARLEASSRKRAKLLGQALDAATEAVALYRKQGMTADLAAALNNASTIEYEIALLKNRLFGRVSRLKKAVRQGEHSAELHRALQLGREEATSRLNSADYCDALARADWYPGHRKRHSATAQRHRTRAACLLGLVIDSTPAWLMRVYPAAPPSSRPSRRDAQYLAVALFGLILVSALLTIIPKGCRPEEVKATPTPSPAAALQLSDDCGARCCTSATLTLTIVAGEPGYVDLYAIDSQARRQPIIASPVGAMEAITIAWQAPDTPGEWSLLAVLNEGQANVRKRLTLVADADPPAIEPLTSELKLRADASTAQATADICPGDEMWLRASVTDDCQLEAVQVWTRQRSRDPWNQVDMEAVEGQEYRHALTAPAGPGIEYLFYARDRFGHEHKTEVAHLSYEPCYTLVYDFVAQAPRATWFFYYSAAVTPEAYATATAHGEDYTMGRAEVLRNAKLEDGGSDAEVLLTTPPWIAEGMVIGQYNLADVKIENGDYLFARIGFLDGSNQGDASFSVILQPIATWTTTPSPVEEASARSRLGGLGPGAITMLSVRDQAYPPAWDSERIKTLISPLPTNIPVAYLYLVVDNGSTAYLDRAVWVDAEIRRPLD